MAIKRKPGDAGTKQRVERALDRARGGTAWRSASELVAAASAAPSSPGALARALLRTGRPSSDAWRTRVYGVLVPPTFWPDAQLFYSGDGLYWRDPFASYALAWRGGRPN